jgi:hypothetical protein
LLNLHRGQIAIKLGLEDSISEPFTANTLPPLFDKLTGQANSVISQSRQKYSIRRQIVTEQIKAYFIEPEGQTIAKKLSKKNQLPELDQISMDNYVNELIELRVPAKTFSSRTIKSEPKL